jgi:hypothetical protein
MEIKTVTVSYSRVHSLQDYNNVKPGLSITVEVTDVEDVEQVVSALNKACRGHVEAQIDEALMAEGHSPKFYAGPRYRVISHNALQMMAVIPQDTDTDSMLSLGWSDGYRYPISMPVAANRQPLGTLWPAVRDAAAKHNWLALNWHDATDCLSRLTVLFEEALRKIGAVQIVTVKQQGDSSPHVVVLPAAPVLVGSWDVEGASEITWHIEPRAMFFRCIEDAANEIGQVQLASSVEALENAIRRGTWLDDDEGLQIITKTSEEDDLPF